MNPKQRTYNQRAYRKRQEQRRLMESEMLASNIEKVIGVQVDDVQHDKLVEYLLGAVRPYGELKLIK